MLLAVTVLFAAQAAASATPTPSPAPTPVATTAAPTPTPVPAADPSRQRSLSDIARERRLGRLTGSGAVVVTTPEPEPDPAPSGTPSARRAGPVRVQDVQDNGAVTDGFVSVYGTVRNTGRVPVCRVKIFLRLYDDHGVLLSNGETTTDLKVVAPGDAATFGGIVKAPAGLRGSRERKPDPLVDGPASTNWQRVGRVDAEIIDVSDVCR